MYPCFSVCVHDDVIKWKHFPRYWSFVRGIHRSTVNSPHKGQWRGALMFSLICARINGRVNNREAVDLRRHRAHYDVVVMNYLFVSWIQYSFKLFLFEKIWSYNWTTWRTRKRFKQTMVAQLSIDNINNPGLIAQRHRIAWLSGCSLISSIDLKYVDLIIDSGFWGFWTELSNLIIWECCRESASILQSINQICKF